MISLLRGRILESANLNSERSGSSIFRHSPLGTGEIRLVDFVARNDEPAVVHARLDDGPQYLALSYCWGSDNCLHPFEINGHVLILNSSLYFVFVELQRRQYRGKVWADAICIDQRNAEEKSGQIPLMGRIYQDAFEVFAWLGSGPREQLNFSKFLEDLSNVLTWEEGTKFWHWIPTKSLMVLINEADSLPSYDDCLWKALIEMLMSPWFRRLWTLQEAVLASQLTFIYGSTTLDLQSIWDFQRVLSLNDSDGFWTTHGIKRADAQEDMFKIASMMQLRDSVKTQSHKVSVLLSYARYRSATNAQDKVYGIYSITSSEFREEVPVDVSASALEVFIRTSRALIKHEPVGLLVLAMADSPNKNKTERPSCVEWIPRAPVLRPALPSWVPDLADEKGPQLLTGSLGFDAGLPTSLVPRFLLSTNEHADHGHQLDNRLSLLGFRLDDVQTVISPVVDFIDVNTADPEYGRKAQKAAQWIRRCIETTQSALKLSGLEALAAVSRVLVCGRPAVDTDMHQKWSYSNSYDLGQVLELLDTAAKGLPWDWDEVGQYYASLGYLQPFRSFFITRTGYLGMGPKRVQSGDQVTVLYGGETPYVIRARPVGLCYELLGESYVDGIMEGQAIHNRSLEVRDQEYWFR